MGAHLVTLGVFFSNQILSVVRIWHVFLWTLACEAHFGPVFFNFIQPCFQRVRQDFVGLGLGVSKKHRSIHHWVSLMRSSWNPNPTCLWIDLFFSEIPKVAMFSFWGFLESFNYQHQPLAILSANPARRVGEFEIPLFTFRFLISITVLDIQTEKKVVNCQIWITTLWFSGCWGLLN